MDPSDRPDETSFGVPADLFHRLVDSVQDYAIFALDVQGRVMSWNRGAERFKKYRAEDIIGRHFSIFYPEETATSGFPQYELEVAAREGRFEDEGWRVRKDGSRFWANVVITALRDEGGELIGFAKVTRDLTARREAEEQRRRLAAEEAAHAEASRRAEELALLNERLQEQACELEAQTEELQAAGEQLQEWNAALDGALSAARDAQAKAERAEAAAVEAYRELDQFAYVASHDLRAPLRGIANLAQWIQDDLGEQVSGESAEHLRLLHGRVHRMEALIDGILAYSRAGRQVRLPERVDTGELVREAIELLAPPEGARIEVPDAMPTVAAERIPLQQVFMNLIGNGLKYAGAQRPDVRVRLGWVEVEDGFEFYVSDNGPGIAPEYHERIWGIFQTLEARDKVEGAGIGLSVVKKIVETRGGSVSVASAPGEGATFRFTWRKAPTEG